MWNVLNLQPEGFTKDMLVQAIECWLDHCTNVLQPLVVSRGTLISCLIKPGWFSLLIQAAHTFCMLMICYSS